MNNSIAGVWVKAETPPKNDDIVFIRYEGYKDVAYCINSEWFNADNDKPLYKAFLRNMEWLDESQPIPVNQDEIKKLAETTAYNLVKEISYGGFLSDRVSSQEAREIIQSVLLNWQEPIPVQEGLREENERLKLELESYKQRENDPYWYWPQCDVDECDGVSCNGGGCWRETGYWSVCSEHSAEYRAGKPQPIMKQSAIEREASRNKETGYLPSQESDRDKEEVKKDEIWNDLGNNLREAKTEEPEW